MRARFKRGSRPRCGAVPDVRPSCRRRCSHLAGQPRRGPVLTGFPRCSQMTVPVPASDPRVAEGPRRSSGGPPVGQRMLVTRPVRAGPAAATPCGATGGVAGRAAHPSPRCHRKRLQLKSLGRGWCPLDEWSDEMSGEGWLGVTVRVSARPPASPAATPRQARPPRPAGSSSRHGSHTSPVSASDPTLGTANDPRSRPSSSLSLTGRDRSGPCPGPHRDPTDDSTRIGDNLFGERMGTMAGQDREHRG